MANQEQLRENFRLEALSFRELVLDVEERADLGTAFNNVDDFYSNVDPILKGLVRLHDIAVQTTDPLDDDQTAVFARRARIALEEVVDLSAANFSPEQMKSMTEYFTSRLFVAQQMNVLPHTDSQVMAVDNALEKIRQQAQVLGSRDLERNLESLRNERNRKLPPPVDKGQRQVRIQEEAQRLELLRDSDYVGYINSLDFSVLHDSERAKYESLLKTGAIAGIAARLSHTSYSPERPLSEEQVQLLDRELDLIKDSLASYRTDADVGGRRLLQEIGMLFQQMLHEHRILSVGAREDIQAEELRKFYRPSVRSIDAAVEGEIQAFLGWFDQDINTAEVLGMKVAAAIRNASPAERAQAARSALTEEERNELLRIRKKIGDYVTDQAVLARNAAGTLDDAERKELEAYISEMQKYTGWLDTILSETDRTGSVAPTSSEQMTVDDIMFSNVERLSSEQLYASGKKLWDQLFARLEVSMSDTKEKVNTRYQLIINELSKRGEPWAGRAQYLDDRRSIYDALAIGVSSMMTVDYESMYNGAAGWLGAKVPSQFDTGNIMRMLYGNKVELSLNSTDQEEQERIRAVNQILPIICELYSDFDPATGKKGPFHATQQFNEARKSAFKAKIKEIWATDVVRVANPDDLTDLQQESFQVAWEMAAILDIRTYYALPFYLAGWSPEDDIGKTIGLAAERFANGKGMYIICGKGKYLVNPAVVVSRFSEDVEVALDSVTKRNNYEFSNEHGTVIWWGYAAPGLDEEHGLVEDEKVAFRRKVGNDVLVPAFFNSFWLPRTRTEGTKVSQKTQKSLLIAAKPLDSNNPPTEKAINLKGLLDGGKAAQEYVKSCEAGFVPSDDMEKDCEKIKQRTEEIAEKISPTKSLITISPRYLANCMYQYARLALLSFGEHHREKHMKNQSETDEYFRLYARFLNNLRATILAAPTTEITIPPEELPDAFRSRFGLPPFDPNGDPRVQPSVTIRDYVLALLPEAEEAKLGGSRIFVQDKISMGGRTFDRKIRGSTKQLILESVQFQPRREHNNHFMLHHLRGETEGIGESIVHTFQNKTRGGSHVEVLEHHHEFHPHPGGNETRDSKAFYLALKLIPYSQEEKQAKE